MASKRAREPEASASKAVPRKRFKYTVNQKELKLPGTSQKGVVFVTGSGDVGQLGLGPDVLELCRTTLLNLDYEIVDVCAGGMHSVCLTKQGKVITFGCNDEGALGRVTEDDDEFTPGEVELPGKVIQVSAGDSHTAALMENGSVFAWGTFRDMHGNLGLTVEGNKRLPYQMMFEEKIVKIASGVDHIVFLTEFGKVYTCGCPEQGQLGRITRRSGDRNARRGCGKQNEAEFLEPAPIHVKPTLRLKFDNIWATSYGTFAKVADKKDIYVCGLNNFHQIGLPQPEPQYQPQKSKEFSKYQWDHISGGQHHTLGLTKDNKLYVIGRKEYGRLGLGEDGQDATVLTEVSKLSSHKIINVASGSVTSFAVSSEGILYAWGMGSNGQLGLGNEDDQWSPTEVKNKRLADRNVIRVSGGGQHTMILCASDNNN